MSQVILSLKHLKHISCVIDTIGTKNYAYS